MTLLRALVRHRRDQGWGVCVYGRRPTQTHTWSRYRDGFYEYVSWDGAALTIRRTHSRLTASYVPTPERAVTLLSAYGLVPDELTPAYAAGEAAGWKAALRLAGEFDHARQVARTAMAVLTPDALEEESHA